MCFASQEAGICLVFLAYQGLLWCSRLFILIFTVGQKLTWTDGTLYLCFSHLLWMYICVYKYTCTHRERMCFIRSTVSDPIEGMLKYIVYIYMITFLKHPILNSGTHQALNVSNGALLTTVKAPAFSSSLSWQSKLWLDKVWKRPKTDLCHVNSVKRRPHELIWSKYTIWQSTGWQRSGI